MTPPPVPVQAIEYRVSEDSILCGLRRCLGLMTIVFAAITAAATILSVVAFLSSRNGLAVYAPAWRVQIICSWVFAAGLAVLQVVGGALCLSQWRGRTLLLITAWAELALSSYGFVASSLLLIGPNAAYYRANRIASVQVFVYYLSHALPSITFAIFTIMLLTSPRFAVVSANRDDYPPAFATDFDRDSGVHRTPEWDSELCSSCACPFMVKSFSHGSDYRSYNVQRLCCTPDKTMLRQKRERRVAAEMLRAAIPRF